MNEYTKKTTIFKDKIVVKLYEEPIKVGRKKPTKKARKKFEDMSDEEKADSIKRREKYWNKRIRELQALALEQKWSLFITLTFRENLTDPAAARHEWRTFIKRLRRKYPDIYFMSVPECQKRGAIHYHFLLGGVDFIPHQELQDLWRHGFVFLERVKGSKVVRYLFKYVSKELGEGREPWQKIYCSRNLKKPRVKTELTDEKAEDIIFAHMDDVIDSGSYIVTEQNGIPINRCQVVTIARNNSR